MKFSVIIATWNEGAQIASALKRLRQISQASPMEILVADGRSTDNTVEEARPWADQILVLEAPNRGRQLDAGARLASGDLLFFLVADAQPPGNWQQALEHFWLAAHSEKVAATAFTVEYGASLSLRLAAGLSNASVRLRGLASSDHGLCTTPQIYRESGGYPSFAYREDVAFCERLGRLGRVALLKERIWPAARRMRRAGAVSCALQHAWLTLRFKLGASPDDLWRSYSGL